MDAPDLPHGLDREDDVTLVFLGGDRIGARGRADGWTLPTMVRIRNGKVVWEHRGTPAGDHPDLAALR